MSETSKAKDSTRETYGALTDAYELFNRELFGGQLPGALITLQRKNKTFGYYCKDRFATRDDFMCDEIAMNPNFFGIRHIIQTLSTLVHESVHQWQDHFGKPSRSGYHNKEWATKMMEVGLYPTHNAMPGGKTVGQHVTHVIVLDGPFDRVCNQFITDSMELEWFDRFPPPADTMSVTKIGFKKYSIEELEAARKKPPKTKPVDPEPGDEDQDIDQDPGEAEEPGTPLLATVGEDGELVETKVKDPTQTPEPVNVQIDLPSQLQIPEANEDNRIKKLKAKKLKYTCPQDTDESDLGKCGTAAWGKRGLHLICGVHNERLNDDLEEDERELLETDDKRRKEEKEAKEKARQEELQKAASNDDDDIEAEAADGISA